MMDAKEFREILDKEIFACRFYKNQIQKIWDMESLAKHQKSILRACSNDNGTFPDDLAVLSKRIGKVGEACLELLKEGNDNGFQEGYSKGLEYRNV